MLKGDKSHLQGIEVSISLQFNSILMRTTVNIQNLRCDACKKKVAMQLNKLEGISNIVIDVSSGTLSFDYRTHNTLEGLRMDLKAIGFPITKDPNRIP